MGSDQADRTMITRRMKKIKGETGFTLLEVIIAISILSIGLLGIAAMQASALKVDAMANTVTEATIRGQDLLEQFQATPYDDVVSGTTTQGNYSISWTVSAISGVTNSKLVTMTVENQGKTLSELKCVKSSLL